jgi:phage/plasmid-like protein (TIGR03299 family)
MARRSQASYAESFADGTRAIAGNREIAWNKVGVLTEGAMTAQEALEKAQLDFTVKVSEDSVGALVDGKLLRVQNKFITYREHKKKGTSAIGVVGNRYTPIQNSDAFEFLNHLVDDSGAIFESAGALGANGEKVFMAIKFPNTMMLANGIDPVDNYIMAINSHDGSSSFTVAVTPLRKVCTNTIAVTMKHASNKISLKHTSGATAKVQQARETLQLVFKYQEAFEKEVESLLSIKISDNEYKKFVETLIPEPTGRDISERQTNSIESVRSELMGLWKADTQQVVANTGWAAYNAVAEYVDWFKPVRGGESKDIARAERIVSGDSYLKNRAHELLLSI